MSEPNSSLMKMMVTMLLLCSGNLAQAFPACVFDKFNVTADNVVASHNSTHGVFFINIYNKHILPTLIVIDQDCNLLYKSRESKNYFSIFEMDDVSGIVYGIYTPGKYSLSIDAYLVKEELKTDIKTVKPVLFNLTASTQVVMLPQFDVGDSPPLDIFVCDDFDKRRCDIYAYDPRKEKYRKKESLACDGKSCDVAKMYRKMVLQASHSHKLRH